MSLGTKRGVSGGAAPSEDFPVDGVWIYKNTEASTYDQYWTSAPSQIRSTSQVTASITRPLKPKYSSVSFTFAFSAYGSGQGREWTDINILKASDLTLIKKYRYGYSEGTTIPDVDQGIRPWNNNQSGALVLTDVTVPFIIQILVYKDSSFFNYVDTLLRSMTMVLK